MSAQQFSIGKLIELLTGLDLTGIPFLAMLNGPSEVGVTLSATNIPLIPFPILSAPLNQITSIDRGLGFIVAFRLPADCGSDPICNFVQLLLGDEAITFRVTGITGPQATLAYRIPRDLTLGTFKLYNVDFGFGLSATRPPTVGLTNIEMDLPVPFPAEGQKPLHFRGTMLIDPAQNVEARLQMIGIYINAFGIPILSFGNVDAGFRSNIICPVCVTQLRLGGEVAIGQNCYTGNKANCVIAQGLFQIDAVDVKENFYYFAVNQLSYRALLKAIGLPVDDVPGIKLLDAVSIKDLEASYSAIDRNIPSGILPGGKTIKAGMVFKGVFSVLFLVNVKVDVQVELLFGAPKSVNALVEVAPITLGPIKFTAASDDSKGAKFELKANLLPPSFFFSIDGSLSIDIIGFKAAVLARIDNTGLSMSVTGPIFGFPANFKLTAQFQSLEDPRSFKNFAIDGRFNGLGNNIVNGVRSALNAAKERINRNLDRLVSKAGDAQRALNAAVGELNLKKHLEGKRRAAFNSAQNALNSAQRKVDNLCSIRNCNSKKSVPKPCVKQSCSCSIHYPCCRRWRCSTCCRTLCVPYPSTCGYHDIPFVDPKCLGENAVCAPIRAAAFVALNAAKGTLKGAEEAVKAAEAATAAATKAWEKADALNRAAQAAVAPVRALFNEILNAINRLLSLFRVNFVSFRVQVQSVADATIGVTISLTVNGRQHTLSADLNLRDIPGYAASLARRFFGKFF